MKKLLFFLLLACGLAHAEPSVPDLTAEQWQEDLDFLANEIATRHRDPFHFASKAGFDQAVSDLRGRIPAMQDYEVVAGLQRLAALIGDGHTFLDTSDVYGRFPLEGYWFGRKLPLIPDTPEVELSGIFSARRFHEEVEVQRGVRAQMRVGPGAGSGTACSRTPTELTGTRSGSLP